MAHYGYIMNVELARTSWSAFNPFAAISPPFRRPFAALSPPFRRIPG